MIRKLTYGVVAIVLGLAVAALGDVVILQNGDRVEGEIVSETPTEVLIKRVYRSGIKFTDKIERSKIARVEKGEAAATSEPASGTAPSRAAATQPVVLSDAEKKELLSNALTHWEKQDYTAAGMALSKLINASSKAELDRMSKGTVEKRIELSLGDMAAEAHLQSAIVRARGQGVTLAYVTEYERPFLVPRLIDAYEEAINKPVSVEPPRPVARQRPKVGPRPKPGEAQPEPVDEPPAESQPAGETFVLAKLLDAPGSFVGSPEEKMAIARHVRFASSLLTARARYDHEYKTKPDVKAEVEAKKKQLAALQRELFAKPGEGASGREPKARPAAPLRGPGAPGQRGLTEEQEQEQSAKDVQKVLDKATREHEAGQQNDSK